jgi:hypothetical protein
MVGKVTRDLSVGLLRSVATMSRRNFARVFKQQVVKRLCAGRSLAAWWSVQDSIALLSAGRKSSSFRAQIGKNCWFLVS